MRGLLRKATGLIRRHLKRLGNERERERARESERDREREREHRDEMLEETKEDLDNFEKKRNGEGIAVSRASRKCRSEDGQLEPTTSHKHRCPTA